ncbi:MAG: hypothetical protein AAFR45_05095, partial [Pseudomonadota bacterium]
ATSPLARSIPHHATTSWLWLAAVAGPVGVIYAQAMLGAAIGFASAVWGWNFVQRIGIDPPQLDLKTRRGLRDINLFRRR